MSANITDDMKLISLKKMVLILVFQRAHFVSTNKNLESRIQINQRQSQSFTYKYGGEQATHFCMSTS